MWTMSEQRFPADEASSARRRRIRVVLVRPDMAIAVHMGLRFLLLSLVITPVIRVSVLRITMFI